MKSHLRRSRWSGSTRRLLEKILAGHWRPRRFRKITGRTFKTMEAQ